VSVPSSSDWKPTRVTPASSALPEMSLMTPAESSNTVAGGRPGFPGVLGRNSTEGSLGSNSWMMSVTTVPLGSSTHIWSDAPPGGGTRMADNEPADATRVSPDATTSYASEHAQAR